jgi:hypothetical protein
MKTDNNTGKDKEFYDLGKKMFDQIPTYETFFIPKKVTPEPVPDIVTSFELSKDGTVWLSPNKANIRLTFDGETGKLKSAEVL